VVFLVTSADSASKPTNQYFLQNYMNYKRRRERVVFSFFLVTSTQSASVSNLIKYARKAAKVINVKPHLNWRRQKNEKFKNLFVLNYKLKTGIGTMAGELRRTCHLRAGGEGARMGIRYCCLLQMICGDPIGT